MSVTTTARRPSLVDYRDRGALTASGAPRLIQKAPANRHPARIRPEVQEMLDDYRARLGSSRRA